MTESVRVWAVALAEAMGESDEALREIAAGGGHARYREEAERIASGQRPSPEFAEASGRIARVMQPLGG